ncbi:MAG: hypothetical protein VX078_11660, partial [Pseudomonadota bacterium]|nr:hypothetical protein [Pseudomonadota bacterium]
MIKKIASFVSLGTIAFSSVAVEITGSSGVEMRYYLQDALYQEQERTYGSFFVSPEVYTEFNDGNDSLLF